MTLQECLEKLRGEDQLIYIGTSGGYNWLWIEAPDYLLEHLAHIDELYELRKAGKTKMSGPFSQRNVVDIYEHTDTFPGISVIIDGYENGYLWWKGEKPRRKTWVIEE